MHKLQSLLYHAYPNTDDVPKLYKKRAKITDTDNEDEDEDRKKDAADNMAEKSQAKMIESSDDENTPILNEPE